MQRTVLITGGAKRLGKIVALHMLQQNYKVLITYHNTPQAELLALQSEYDITCLPLDLSSRAEVEKFASQHLDGVDILINNAALFQNDSFSSYSQENLDRTMQINAFAPMHFMQRMCEMHNANVVINLLDRWAADLPHNFFSYTLSKTLLKNATMICAKHFNQIYGIELGFTLYNDAYPLDFFEKLHKKYPSSPEKLCAAIDFILTHDNLTSSILDLTKWNQES